MKKLIKLVLAAALFLGSPKALEAPGIPAEYLHTSQQNDCAIEALWYEARGESLKGIQAVFTVIHNRSIAKNKTYCEIIKEPKQFSYRNAFKGKRMKIHLKNLKDKQILNDIYDIVTKSSQILPSDVLWYHTVNVKPKWSKRMKVHQRIGKHVFLVLKSSKGNNLG